MSQERPFIPYRSIVYRRIALVSAVGRYIITFSCIGLVLLIWFYGIYSPIETLLQKRTIALSDQQLFMDRIIQTYNKVCDVQQNIKQLMGKLPCPELLQQSHEQQMEYCTRMLFDILTAIKSTLLSYTANPIIIKNNHGIYAICLTLESSLSNIGTFFTQIRQKRLPIKPVRIHVSTYNNSFLVVIDMHVLTYKKDPST